MPARGGGQGDATIRLLRLVRPLLYFSSVNMHKETNMRRYMMSALLIASMAGVPALVGCDRTIHEDQKTTRSPNGDTSVQDQKTVQHPDGSVTTETEKHNANP